MRRRLLLFFLLTIAYNLFGQNEKSSDNQPELFENIHLHINKTTFLQGERLWFKAYLRNQIDRLPSFETTNLHVGIYGNEGKEVKRKLLYVKDGLAEGDFAIDSTFTDSEYTVLAWTNYMRNFEKLVPFRQKIHILRNRTEENGEEVNMKISIYPEGGQLIEGAFGQIGIQVDNGLRQGVSVNNLELVDDSGKVIKSNIATNMFGMGKTGFMVEKGKRYFLQRKRQGLSLIREELPKAIKGQLGFNIDNNGKEKVLLKLMASKETFLEKDGDIHTMAIYQDDFTHFEDLEVNEDEAVLSIDRKSLPFGINTAVLFDLELKPIAHRMFFNHRRDNKTLGSLEIEHCFTEFGDSVQVDLILPKDMENEANISLSAMPSFSNAYNPDNSVVSSFLVRPYLQKYFQDHYFFDNQDRKKQYELDKRLLIEGWGRYDWDSRGMEQGRLKYEMENGITFEGTVADADLNQEEQISLLAELSGGMRFEELSETKTFKSAMVLFDDDSLGISLIGKKGILRKPRAEVLFNDLSSLKELNDWLQLATINRHLNLVDDKQTDGLLNIGERTIALEEVTVTESALKINKTEMFVPKGSLLPISEGRIIGDEEIKRYNSVSSFLSTLGYNRTMGYDSDGFLVDVLLSPKKNVPVSVNSGLLNVPLSRVSAIYYDIDKEVYVSIVLRSSPYERPEDRNKFLKFAIENGYARPQEYFTPSYPDYNSSLFKTHGALDWKASVYVDAEVPTTITIPLKNQKEIQLYIEGMGKDGLLLSETKTILLD